MLSPASFLRTLASAPPLLRSNAAFSAAGRAASEIAASGLVGSAFVHGGALPPPTVRALAETTFSVLLPLYLFVSLLDTAASGRGRGAAMLGAPLAAVLHAYATFRLSREVLFPVFGIGAEEGRSLSVCCAFGNAGTIPLIFSEALFRSRPEVMAECAAQISLFLAGWSPFFWSFGRRALLPDADEAGGATRRRDGMRRLFPPPVVGTAAGLVVAATPLRKLFVSDGGTPPLGVLAHSLRNFGRAANPLALLVLMSSLAAGAGMGPRDPKEPTPPPPRENTEGEGASPLRRLACVSAARSCASPLIMIGVLRLLQKLGAVGNPREHPAQWFVLLLQSAVPPAQNSVLMLQAAGKTGEAEDLARFLLGSYAVSAVSLVLVVTVALAKLGLA